MSGTTSDYCLVGAGTIQSPITIEVSMSTFLLVWLCCGIISGLLTARHAYRCRGILTVEDIAVALILALGGTVSLVIIVVVGVNWDQVIIRRNN